MDGFGIPGLDILLHPNGRMRMQDQNRIRYLNSIAHVTKSTTQTISNNTWTVVTFDIEEFDPDNMHSLVTNTSRLTARITGKYIAACCLSFAANSTANRKLTIEKNSAGTETALNIVGMNSTFGSTIGSTFMAVNAVTPMVAGDYVELFAYQNSGGNLGIDGIDTWGHVTFLALIYVGE